MRPASADDLHTFVETTQFLLDVAGADPGVYVLEERPDGSVAVTDHTRYTTYLLDTVAALLALLSPGLSFAGMGWSEEEDAYPDPYAKDRERPYLREIDHKASTAHSRLAARSALQDRVAAAGPQAIFLWEKAIQNDT